MPSPLPSTLHFLTHTKAGRRERCSPVVEHCPEYIRLWVTHAQTHTHMHSITCMHTHTCTHVCAHTHTGVGILRKSSSALILGPGKHCPPSGQLVVDEWAHATAGREVGARTMSPSVWTTPHWVAQRPEASVLCLSSSQVKWGRQEDEH